MPNDYMKIIITNNEGKKQLKLLKDCTRDEKLIWLNTLTKENLINIIMYYIS